MMEMDGDVENIITGLEAELDRLRAENKRLRAALAGTPENVATVIDALYDGTPRETPLYDLRAEDARDVLAALRARAGIGEAS